MLVGDGDVDGGLKYACGGFNSRREDIVGYMEGCHPWYDLEKRGTQHKFVRGLMQLGFLLFKNSAGGHGSLVKAFWRSKNLLSLMIA